LKTKERKYEVKVDGKAVEVTRFKEQDLRHEEGSAVLYVADDTGDLELRGAFGSLDSVYYNGRLLPTFLGTLKLASGDLVEIGDEEETAIRVEVSPGETTEGEDEEIDARPSFAVRLKANQATVDPKHTAFIGLDQDDTRIMVKCDDENLFVAGAESRDACFMWKDKPNYLFPYHYYKVTPGDEVRVGGKDGVRVEFPTLGSADIGQTARFSPGDHGDDLRTVDSARPLMYVDNERVRTLVASQIESDNFEMTDPNAKRDFIENLVCLNTYSHMSSGWRLRTLAYVNGRKFYYARRLADEYPAMIEFSVPDKNLEPREYHERSDFALSSVRHPHLVRIMDYGTIPNPGYHHGEYHVRVMERFTGAGCRDVLRQFGRFDARTALSIMIPALAALEEAIKFGGKFDASALLKKRNHAEGVENGPDKLGEGGAFIASRFSLSQLWLCSLQDGRIAARVDCFTRKPDNKHSYADWTDHGFDYEETVTDIFPVVRAGLVLYELVTGKPPYAPGSRANSGPTTAELAHNWLPALTKDLGPNESRLEEIALACATSRASERPKSISVMRKLLEDAWTQLYPHG